jgi:hypothetical protein
MLKVVLKEFAHFCLKLEIKALGSLVIDECVSRIFIVVVIHLTRGLLQSVS